MLIDFHTHAFPEKIAEKTMGKLSYISGGLVFASDMPWHRPAWEKQLIETLDISQEDKDKIYYKNALKLLDIKNNRNDG